jgi:hypothetical protein
VNAAVSENRRPLNGNLVAREALLQEISTLLQRGQNVMLFGPAGVGKTALVHALRAPDVVILDPFEHVSPHLAAHIRRAIERGVVHLAATRSLDRKHLGAVRRIAFWFTTVRVPPLPARWIRHLVRCECLALSVPADAITSRWITAAVRLARGRAGMGLAIARAAARIREERGSLPSPAVAYIEASIRQAGIPRLASEGDTRLFGAPPTRGTAERQ